MTTSLDILFSRFLPPTRATQVEAGADHTPGAPTKVTARLENLSAGTCPYCKQPMRLSHAAGFLVYLCDTDRAVCPVPSDVEAEYLARPATSEPEAPTFDYAGFLRGYL